MSTLATLVVKLVGDIGGFTSPMADAETTAEKTNGSLVSKLGSGLATVGKIAAGVMAAGVITATTAMVGGITAANNWANQLDDLSDVLGTTANESAAITVALKPFGEAAQELPGQVGKLVMSLKDAKGGLSDTGKYMKGLGIQFQDSNGKLLPTTKLLENIANKISQMPDGLDKTQAMMTLFGKSGKGMSDALNAMANGGLDAAAKKAAAFGLAIGDDGVNASLQFQKGLSDIELAGQGLMVTIGNALLPMLVPLIQQFTTLAVSVMPSLRDGINTAINALSPFIKLIYDLIYGLSSGGDPFGVIVNGVYNFLTALGMSQGQAASWAVGIASFAQSVIAWLQQAVAWVQANWPAIQTAIVNAFQQAQAVVQPIVTAIFTVVSTIFAAIVGFLASNGPQIESFVSGVLLRIHGIIAGVLAILQATIVPVFQSIAQFVSDNQESIRAGIEFVWSVIKLSITTVLTVIEGIIKAIMAAIKGDWQAAWDALKGIVTSVWDSIRNWFEGVPSQMVEMGKRTIEGLVLGLKNAADQVVTALTKIVSDAIEAVKKFLGIHSPSTVAGEIGDNTVLGLVNSILAGRPLVARAMEALTGDGIDAGMTLATQSVAPGGGSGAGGRPLQVNLNMDGQMWKRFIINTVTGEIQEDVGRYDG